MHHTLAHVLDEKGRHVHTIAPEATVADAVAQMTREGIGALLVCHDDRPVGIFTERDVLRRVVDSGRDPRSTRVSDVMTRELVVVRPATTISETMAIVTEKRCRHLPVLDGDDLVGLVSIGDLTRWMTRDQRVRIQDLVNYITGKYPGP